MIKVNLQTKEKIVKKENTFLLGDIVKLKSGGPDMTVRSVPNAHSIYYDCQWFAGKKLEHGSFPGDSLEPAKANKS